MATKARKTWSAANDQQLLVAIVNTLPPGVLDYEKIAQYLGDDLTGNAIHHRIRRLKGMVSQSENSPGASSPSPKKQAASQAQTDSPKKRKLG
ncbi:uncharacterized protein TRUGW13939_09582 [Talaromyces rugulosus]|uniref:Myb-like domain-containing protein n=1 Tax=Talaromyces rugulosus TaxID=121627 RepID=A0A7H8R9J9_TALRU|nr:uncharacterized protein TRUGW13939_09582 [Talaromyces rugulosus]QKX62421.1 hypothetical protein TRUGW13939_09582 [Talaromyces rugulosus]